MSFLPIITPLLMEKLLLRLGFKKDRQNGSHCFYKHSDGLVATIPFHKGRDMSKSLTREILRQIGLSVSNFIKEIKNLTFYLQRCFPTTSVSDELEIATSYNSSL